VHGHDAAGHIVETAVNKTSVLNHFEKRFLIGVLSDRFCEITIAIGIIRD
jgi:hypothetical protein